MKKILGLMLAASLFSATGLMAAKNDDEGSVKLVELTKEYKGFTAGEELHKKVTAYAELFNKLASDTTDVEAEMKKAKKEEKTNFEKERSKFEKAYNKFNEELKKELKKMEAEKRKDFYGKVFEVEAAEYKVAVAKFAEGVEDNDDQVVKYLKFSIVDIASPDKLDKDEAKKATDAFKKTKDKHHKKLAEIKAYPQGFIARYKWFIIAGVAATATVIAAALAYQFGLWLVVKARLIGLNENELAQVRAVAMARAGDNEELARKAVASRFGENTANAAF